MEYSPTNPPPPGYWAIHNLRLSPSYRSDMLEFSFVNLKCLIPLRSFTFPKDDSGLQITNPSFFWRFHFMYSQSCIWYQWLGIIFRKIADQICNALVTSLRVKLWVLVDQFQIGLTCGYTGWFLLDGFFWEKPGRLRADSLVRTNLPIILPYTSIQSILLKSPNLLGKGNLYQPR